MLLLRLPPDGTLVETAFDANRQQAQASEDHAHARRYGHGWQCLERTTGRGCWPRESTVTSRPWIMLCAVCSRLHATHAARRCVSHGCVDGHAVAASTASCQALPFPCCLPGIKATREPTPKIAPILLTIQHNQVTMTSDPTTPLPSLKRSACRRACAAFETRHSIE